MQATILSGDVKQDIATIISNTKRFGIFSAIRALKKYRAIPLNPELSTIKFSSAIKCTCCGCTTDSPLLNNNKLVCDDCDYRITQINYDDKRGNL